MPYHVYESAPPSLSYLQRKRASAPAPSTSRIKTQFFNVASMKPIPICSAQARPFLRPVPHSSRVLAQHHTKTTRICNVLDPPVRSSAHALAHTRTLTHARTLAQTQPRHEHNNLGGMMMINRANSRNSIQCVLAPFTDRTLADDGVMCLLRLECLNTCSFFARLHLLVFCVRIHPYRPSSSSSAVGMQCGGDGSVITNRTNVEHCSDRVLPVFFVLHLPSLVDADCIQHERTVVIFHQQCYQHKFCVAAHANARRSAAPRQFIANWAICSHKPGVRVCPGHTLCARRDMCAAHACTRNLQPLPLFRPRAVSPVRGLGLGRDHNIVDFIAVAQRTGRTGRAPRLYGTGAAAVAFR